MKSLVIAAVAMTLAGAASASVYKCEFTPNATRGWAPKVMYIDDKSKRMNFFGEKVKVRHTGEYSNWDVRLTTTKGKVVPVSYTLQRDSNSNKAWMNIRVNSRQAERSAGTCKRLR